MTTRRAVGALAWLYVMLLLTGCSVFSSHSSAPTPQDELRGVLAQADREALASRFGVADRLLADFADQHRNTVEGYEATLRRALYKLDSTNQTASPHDALVMLDAYLASSLTVPHRGVATALRRVAAVLERAPAVVTTTVTAPSGGSGSGASDKARDDEIARLKEELAKANAELERIKRRVATPKP